MTLKDNVNYPYFKYETRVSHDAYWVQIWWFHLKSVKIYHADKVKFTDGQTDRCNQRQYLFGLKGEGVKRGWLNDVGHLLWWHIKCAKYAARNP